MTTQQLKSAPTGESAEDLRASRRRGLLLAVAGAASVGVNFVTAKYALQGMNLLTFTSLWFLTAWVYSAIYMAVRRNAWLRQFRAHWRPLIWVGIYHGCCALTGFAGLRLLDPTVSAFIGRTSAVFGVLLGLVVLGERPSLRVWLGMAVTILGIGVLSYAAGAGEVLGIMLTLLGAIFASLGLMAAKTVAGKAGTGLMVCARAATIFLIVFPMTLASGQLDLRFSGTHLAAVLVGVVFGPVASQFLFFRALTSISLSEVSVIRATTPLFVAVYALVFLHMCPDLRQVIGGAVVLAGIIILAKARPVGERGREAEGEGD